MVESASGPGWRASCHRRNCRVEMMPSLTDSQTRSSSVARRPMAPIGFEFRTADGRVHRAMRESGARVPPRRIEGAHFPLRAVQPISYDSHSPPLLQDSTPIDKHAYVQALGSAHYSKATPATVCPSPTVGYFAQGKGRSVVRPHCRQELYRQFAAWQMAGLQ